MQKIFGNPSEIEKKAKQFFKIPDFLMMENAADFMCNFILSKYQKGKIKILIVCGKGNNGGDGYALSRKLKTALPENADVSLFCFEKPNQNNPNQNNPLEAFSQYQLCKQLKIKFLSKEELVSKITSFDFVVDCLYGIGFHGELPKEAAELILFLNNQTSPNTIKIACDIPSGIDSHGNISINPLNKEKSINHPEKLCFKADYTISMGTQKLCFYTDEVKNFCGKILTANLGIERNLFETGDFEQPNLPAAFLIEKDDVKLPFRKNKAAHKGTFGHTSIFAGEKSGASIIAATTALNLGSGLTTLIRRNQDNLSQFKISPELMISDSIPAKTTCLVIGPGYSNFTQKDSDDFFTWWENTENPAVVFDAGMFSSSNFIQILSRTAEKKDGRIILTPHLLEFSRFCKALKNEIPNFTVDFNTSEDQFCSVETLANNPEIKIEIGKKITKIFPNVVLVVKSANTFIFCDDEVYIISDGAPSLAKGGTGDVLAGMTGALLSQGYSSKDAAISSCEIHALAAFDFGSERFDLTPFKLITEITNYL